MESCYLCDVMHTDIFNHEENPCVENPYDGIYYYEFEDDDLKLFQRNLNSCIIEKYTPGIVYWTNLIKVVNNDLYHHIDAIYICAKCSDETSKHHKLCDGMCFNDDKIHTGSCGIKNENCFYCAL